MKTKVVNFLAGPGTGKSTTAAALFAELKYRNINCEMILEYAKDAAWEKRGPKVFRAQEYIFGKQHFRMARVADEVPILVTDSPLVLGLVYMPKDFAMPSLGGLIVEAFDLYDNLNIFLRRNKPYNQSGRYQNEAEAKEKDQEIIDMLVREGIDYVTMDFGRENVEATISIMRRRGWIE